MEEGEIEVDSIEPIGFPDITPQLARESGFLGIIDLLKVAKHGKGDRIYLIRFHYVPPRAQRGARRAAPASKPEATTTRQQTQAARSPATRQSRKKSPVFGAEQSKRR